MPQKDWVSKALKEHLISYRKHLWTDEQIKRIAKWAKFEPNKSVLDVGCGLGYLGYLFSPYFKQGSYQGIDISTKLLEDAEVNFSKMDLGIDYHFEEGDCYNLQFEDNSFDFVMCQTVLMHLEFPQKALDEMYRVLIPGGTMLCLEPDNSTSEVKENYCSVHEYTIDEKMLIKRVALHRIAGQKILKRGDWGLGTKLPELFYKSGLSEIDMKQNEKINFIVPPYDRAENQQWHDWAKNYEKSKKTTKLKLNKIHKEEFLAGGGSEYLYRKYRKMIKKYSNLSEKLIDAFKAEELFSCYGPHLLFACRGFKPHMKDK